MIGKIEPAKNKESIIVLVNIFVNLIFLNLAKYKFADRGKQ